MTSPRNVRATNDHYAGHVEPALAVNPRNPQELLGAAQYFPPSGQETPGTFVSFDGGRSWHDNGALPLPPGYVGGFDVTVAFTPQGIGFVAADLTTGLRNGIFVWRTGNGGRSFGAPVAVGHATHRPRFADHPWLAIDDRGTLAVAWTVFDGAHSAQLHVSRSTDGGRHFEADRVLPTPGARFAIIPVLLAGPGGRLSLGYGATSQVNYTQPVVGMVMTSADRGLHFSLPHRIVSILPSTDPLLRQDEQGAAVDPRDGTLYVAVSRSPSHTQRSHIMLTRSHDQGRTWSPLVRVDQEPGSAQADHLHPQVTVTPNGSVYVSYEALQRGRLTVFLARSSTRGARFGFDGQMSSVSFPAPQRLGEYEALATSGDTIQLVWTDTRMGTRQIFAASMPTG
jgi:hypothetical protein